MKIYFTNLNFFEQKIQYKIGIFTQIAKLFFKFTPQLSSQLLNYTPTFLLSIKLISLITQQSIKIFFLAHFIVFKNIIQSNLIETNYFSQLESIFHMSFIQIDFCDKIFNSVQF